MIRVVTFVLRDDPEAPPPLPSETLLLQRLPALGRPPPKAAEQRPGESGDEGGNHEITLALNPRAWGNLPSSSRVTLQIPKAPNDLRTALSRELDTAYALGGWPMVDQLAQGVFGFEQYASLGEFVPRGKLAGSQMSDARSERLMSVLRERVPPERAALFRAFEQLRGELADWSAACLNILEEYVVCRAVTEELPACDAATLNEARRYLSLSATDDASVRKALADPAASHIQALVGPEGRALAKALVELSGTYRKFKNAQQEFEKTLPSRKTAKGAVWLALLSPALGFSALAAGALADRLKGAGDAKAGARLARASGEFQAHFAETAVRYPVVFKLGHCLDQGESVWRGETVRALQDTLEASAELSDLLGEEPEQVWKFTRLVERSVVAGLAAYAPLAARAAADRMLLETRTPPFARLNAGIQLLSMPLGLVPFPPVQGVVALVSVLGDAAEMLESYLRTREQRLGFRASLDPGRSLGADSSYTSTLIQGAFVALGLLPIPGALKEWAESGTEAARGAALRRAALEAAGEVP